MSTQTEPKLVTQIDFARAGQITPQMKEVAEREHRDPEYIRERVADGRIAIPANIVHIKKGMRAFGVGEGLSTKVNVNLGISGDKADAAEEWKKVKIAEDFGADAIMDLSNSGKTRQFRQQLIDETPLMVGTVPMYDAIGYMEKPLVKLTAEDLLATVRAHAEDGVDFLTIHVGINKNTASRFPIARFLWRSTPAPGVRKTIFIFISLVFVLMCANSWITIWRTSAAAGCHCQVVCAGMNTWRVG